MTDAPRKPVIEYPCEWEFRIIGTDPALIRNAVAAVVGEQEHSLCDSNKKGRYLSMILELQVPSEAERNRIYRELCEYDHIRMVL